MTDPTVDALVKYHRARNEREGSAAAPAQLQPDTPPQDATALAACPFCGGAMQFRKALWPSDGNVDAIIHAAPTKCGLSDFADGTVDESILAAWNTRAASQTPDAKPYDVGFHENQIDQYEGSTPSASAGPQAPGGAT